MRIHSLLLLSTLLLTACSSVESQFPPTHSEVDVPRAFIGSSDKVDAVTIEDNWYLSFEDKTLNTQIDKVLGTNYDIRSAIAKLEGAIQQRRIARSKRLPGLDIQATANRNRAKEGNEAGVNETLLSAQASLNWEFDLRGHLTALEQSAQLKANASEEELKSIHNLVVASYIQSWLDFQTQTHLQALTEKQITTNGQRLELIRLRFEKGQSNALDILQQEQAVMKLQSELPRTENKRFIAIRTLSILSGRPDPDPIPTQPLPLLPAFPSLGSPADLIENRPDLKASQFLLAAADKEVAAAIAERLPKIDLNLIHQTYDSSLSQIAEKQITSLIGNLAWSVFSSGKRTANINYRRAKTEENLYAFRKQLLEAISEVEIAINNEQTSKDRIQVLVKRLDSASKTLDESIHRYLNGVESYLSVIAAQNTVQAIERDLLYEKRLLLGARVSLHLALGSSIHPSLSHQ